MKFGDDSEGVPLALAILLARLTSNIQTSGVVLSVIPDALQLTVLKTITTQGGEEKQKEAIVNAYVWMVSGITQKEQG